MKNRLKEIRKRKGLSAEKIAENANIMPMTVYNSERGRCNPTLVVAMKIAKELNVDVEYIWELEKSDY